MGVASYPRIVWLSVVTAGLLLGAGCVTGITRSGSEGGSGGAPASRSGGGGSTVSGESWEPETACAPALPRRVVRLADRHIANAVRELLELQQTPALRTVSGPSEGFLPNQAPGISGAVSTSLRKVAEAASLEAVGAGRPAVACSGDETGCAGTFIDRFAARAFRRPLTATEREGLLQAYAGGRAESGTHADGIRTVIEAVLQAPSFLYHTELGTKSSGGYALTPYELATTLSLFLRDALPDDGLWSAAQSGKLSTPAGVAAEVDRLLGQPDVQANVARIVTRLFQVYRLDGISKAPRFTAFDSTAAQAMADETNRFVHEVLWKRGGSLTELLTSRESFANASLAPIYGVAAKGTSLTAVTLPERERAGILTQASLLAAGASADESSVVKRGVFIARQLLCLTTPSPTPADLAQGEELKKLHPTERGRAEARAATPRCASCHSLFDPLGLPFEGYDAIGRHRDRIETPAGPVAVDSHSTLKAGDMSGPVADAVELAQKLAKSRAVKACLAQQMASYAFAQPLGGNAGCATRTLFDELEKAGGDLTKLVRSVALWEGLRLRTDEVQP